MSTMIGKVLDPRNYFSLGLRENAYLIAAGALLMMLVTGFSHRILVPRLRKFPVRFAVAETLLLAVMLALTVIFLRPIEQFIYFQF